jgi:hypothetical protein
MSKTPGDPTASYLYAADQYLQERKKRATSGALDMISCI